MKFSLGVVSAALFSLGALAQGVQKISHAEVTSLLSKFNCKISAPGVNGGAGQQCMNGLVETLLIAQGKIYIDGAKEQIEAAYPKIKQAFPAAVLTPSFKVVIPL